MIELTPLDVRKKGGDFRKALRGYDPEQVDGFLEIVAERMETLVREHTTLRERAERLREQVAVLEGREAAVQEALVVAQQLREEVKDQARREVELLRQEAEAEKVRRESQMERQLAEAARGVADLEARRVRLLRSLKLFLQSELAALDGEEARPVEGGNGVAEQEDPQAGAASASGE